MKENEKMNYLAYFNGRKDAERHPSDYVRRDDASHKCEENESEYYEWWYFDASFSNGYHLVMTYHYRNFFLNPMIPSLQFFIYLPDGKRIDRYELCDPKNISANPNWCELHMNKSHVQDMGTHYDVEMNIKGDGFKLKFTNTVPSWKPGTGFNYMNPENGDVAGWVVAMPGAKVEGELYVKGQTIPVEGFGYHDHNWGNYHCSKTYRGWYWGRVHSERYTVDWGWVLPRNSEAPVASPLLIARDGQIELSTDMMDVTFGEMEKDPGLGQEYPRSLVIRTDNLGVKMELLINTHRVVEKMPLPKRFEWDMFYYRFLADYTMVIEIDGERETLKGEMLHEYVLL